MRLIRGRASTAFVKDFSAKPGRSAAPRCLAPLAPQDLGLRTTVAAGRAFAPGTQPFRANGMAQSLRSSSAIRPALQFPAKTEILATSPSPRFLHQKVASAPIVKPTMALTAFVELAFIAYPSTFSFQRNATTLLAAPEID